MTTHNYDITIIGAGLAGLTCAAALLPHAQSGLKIAVIAPKTNNPDNRTTALTPHSKALLESWGIWQAIEPFTLPITQIALTDSLRSDFVRMPSLTFNENDSFEPYFYMVENAKLLLTLQTHLEKSAITFINASVDTHAEKTLTLNSGEILTTGLIIAADGFESPVRTRSNINISRKNYTQSALTCTLSHTKPNNSRAIQHFFETGPLAFLPLNNNKINIVWSLPHDEAAHFCKNQNTLLAAISKIQSNTLGEFSFETKPIAYPLKTHVAQQFYGQNLALIGDAAHRIHPLAGQGLNQGYKDIEILLAQIFEHNILKNGENLQKSLQNYSKKRHSEVLLLQHGQTALNGMFANPSHSHRFIRQIGMNLINSAPLLKKTLMRIGAGR